MCRVWYIYLFSFTARLKYYGVWSLTEGACILSGLGYNGVDKNGKLRWDRVTNIDPWAIETAQNTRGYLESWNMNTNKWLRNYVYLRVTPKGKKPGFRSTIATFGTSGKAGVGLMTRAGVLINLQLFGTVSPRATTSLLSLLHLSIRPLNVSIYHLVGAKSHCCSFPPARPPLLPRCRPEIAGSPQESLRPLYHHHHAARLLLHSGSIPRPILRGVG